MKSELLHPIYIPFTEDQLRSHFSRVKIGKDCVRTDDAHVQYFKKSIKRYEEFTRSNPDRRGMSITKVRYPCQIEKDERFWIASSLMTIFYSESRIKEFSDLFSNTYGLVPPIEGLNSWEECFTGDLHLFFEPNLPSPKSYQQWLQDNLKERNLIPYVLDSAHEKKVLEGATNVDALLLNSSNAFAVVIEAKVLSDISHDITYDTMRNQIARNIDVMLERNEGLCDPLNKRDPNRTLFLLVTPQIFMDNPGSRLYGYKMNEYRLDSGSLSRDLPHRKDIDWERISRRAGWTTWEDRRIVNVPRCRWLQ